MTTRFGERLRHWRMRASLTQAQLANSLNYDHSLVSRVETGTRVATPTFAHAADELLGAGGELIALAASAERHSRRECGSPVPLPRPGSSGPRLDLGPWQRRPFPVMSVECPLHPGSHCGAADLTAAGEVDQPGGGASVHGYLAWLAIYGRAGVELANPADLLGPVEEVTLDLVRQVDDAHGRHQRTLLHLAAEYAELAGQLRAHAGNPVNAVLWLHRSASWASSVGNFPALCRALTMLGTLSMLEGDERSSAHYAEAARAADHNRRWADAHGGLLQARACALAGDAGSFNHHLSTSMRALDRLDERDRTEAPWLTEEEGVAFVNGVTAGGLRDLATRTRDRTAIHRATAIVHKALSGVPDTMVNTRVLLTLRLADCVARSGDVESGARIAGPALPQARTARSPFIRRELALLRASLTR